MIEKKREELEARKQAEWDRVKKYLAALGVEVNDLVIQKVITFDMFEQGYKYAIGEIGNGDIKNQVEEEPQKEAVPTETQEGKVFELRNENTNYTDYNLAYAPLVCRLHDENLHVDLDKIKNLPVKKNIAGVRGNDFYLITRVK